MYAQGLIDHNDIDLKRSVVWYSDSSRHVVKSHFNEKLGTKLTLM